MPPCADLASDPLAVSEAFFIFLLGLFIRASISGATIQVATVSLSDEVASECCIDSTTS